MKTLKKGDKAPEFNLKDQNGNSVRLNDFYGRKLLIYFYPKADTPGCTKQACSIKENKYILAKKDIAIIGVSPDPINKQKQFDMKYNLDFPLLSDEDHKIAEYYGAWGEKSMYGKKYMGIIRSAFLLNGRGIVIDVWYKVKPEDTISNILKLIGK